MNKFSIQNEFVQLFGEEHVTLGTNWMIVQ